MTRTSFVLLLLTSSGALSACGDDGGIGPGSVDAAGGVGEPAELAGMTLFHNQVRAAVDTATPLPALQWDPALAAYAAAYLAGCPDAQPPVGLVDHNPARQNVAGYTYIGENIYASSGSATAKAAVDSWASEKADYDYATNGCTGTCGHYTQVVWRETTHVGCAIHACAGLMYPSTILCDYGPGGNDGSKPY
ncbi:MAG: CAP domain-containing protein [Proteobacteria bacterium]|nr:CAP domain-containing protein [Pseudomonadota bacterium]